MGMSILTNSAASSAQRFLGMASDKASSSISKMSSGNRLVKASEDAASLAISNKLKADIATLNQAGRNASQGASLLQVANGGLSQIGDILTRMKTLSTEVVNGTLSTSERQFAQQEFSQLITQVSQTATQTQVNGIQVLNGGDKTLSATDKSTIAAAAITSGVSTLTATVPYPVGAVTLITGQVEGRVNSITVTDLTGQHQIDMKIGNQNFRGIIDDAAPIGTPVKMFDITNDQNTFTMTNTAATTTAGALQTSLRGLFNLSSTTAPVAQFQAAQATEATSAALLRSGTTTFANIIKTSGSTADGNYTLTTKFNAGNLTTGVKESITFRLQDENGQVYEASIADTSGTGVDGVFMAATETKTLKFGNGIELTVDGTAVNNLDTASLGSADARGVRFKVNAGNTTSLDFQVGVKSTDLVSITFDSMSTASLGIASLNIETVAGAQAASGTIDTAINRVNTSIAQVGALQSRMEYIQANLATVTENTEAANGIFKDVDMAKEMTEFTKQQALAQAGIAMLSQANQMPQQLVRLLQG